MRNLAIFTMVLLTVAMALPCYAEQLDDDAIKDSLEWICTGFEGRKTDDIDTFLRCRMGGDSNALVRIAKEMSVTHTNLVVYMMGIVRRYGTVDDLPFLYSHVAKHEPHSGVAVTYLLQMEGLTTNSFAAIQGMLLTVTNASNAYSSPDFASGRANSCRKLLRYAFERNPQDDLCDLARSVALDYARQDNREVIWLDDGFCRWYPGYQYSTNRLDVLRSVLALGVNEFQIGYVTNAIHEIEAQLPPE